MNCYITDSSFENNKYKYEFIQVQVQISKIDFT